MIKNAPIWKKGKLDFVNTLGKVSLEAAEARAANPPPADVPVPDAPAPSNRIYYFVGASVLVGLACITFILGRRSKS